VQQENLFMGIDFLPIQSFLLLPWFDYGHTTGLDTGLCNLSWQKQRQWEPTHYSGQLTLR